MRWWLWLVWLPVPVWGMVVEELPTCAAGQSSCEDNRAQTLRALAWKSCNKAQAEGQIAAGIKAFETCLQQLISPTAGATVGPAVAPTGHTSSSGRR